MTIRANLVQIGNSRGVRIPKPVLEQTGISDEVTIEVLEGKLVIEPVASTRDGWDAAFAMMSDRGDDTLSEIASVSDSWDDDEWVWE